MGGVRGLTNNLQMWYNISKNISKEVIPHESQGKKIRV